MTCVQCVTFCGFLLSPLSHRPNSRLLQRVRLRWLASHLGFSLFEDLYATLIISCYAGLALCIPSTDARFVVFPCRRVARWLRMIECRFTGFHSDRGWCVVFFLRGGGRRLKCSVFRWRDIVSGVIAWGLGTRSFLSHNIQTFRISNRIGLTTQ